mmetsp:Transcript_31210/g.93102  ORF Transcript_31210/g.93102 Transcript_31210/m.93102 type:complete len:164 (-) Transcript_31210:4419-4910(-)
MWRATLIEAEVLGWASGPLSMGPLPGRGTSIRLVVGDAEPGGARVALEFPYQPRAELLVPGEPAELLVLSQDDDFVEFKVGVDAWEAAIGMLWACGFNDGTVMQHAATPAVLFLVHHQCLPCLLCMSGTCPICSVSAVHSLPHGLLLKHACMDAIAAIASTVY